MGERRRDDVAKRRRASVEEPSSAAFIHLSQNQSQSQDQRPERAVCATWDDHIFSFEACVKCGLEESQWEGQEQHGRQDEQEQGHKEGITYAGKQRAIQDRDEDDEDEEDGGILDPATPPKSRSASNGVDIPVLDLSRVPGDSDEEEGGHPEDYVELTEEEYQQMARLYQMHAHTTDFEGLEGMEGMSINESPRAFESAEGGLMSSAYQSGQGYVPQHSLRKEWEEGYGSKAADEWGQHRDDGDDQPRRWSRDMELRQREREQERARARERARKKLNEWREEFSMLSVGGEDGDGRRDDGREYRSIPQDANNYRF